MHRYIRIINLYKLILNLFQLHIPIKYTQFINKRKTIHLLIKFYDLHFYVVYIRKQ